MNYIEFNAKQPNLGLAALRHALVTMQRMSVDDDFNG